MDKKIIPVQISPGQMGTITLSTPQRSNQQTPPALAVEQVDDSGFAIKDEIPEEILMQEEVNPLSTRVATDGNRQMSFEDVCKEDERLTEQMIASCALGNQFNQVKLLNNEEKRQFAYYEIAKHFKDYAFVNSEKNSIDDKYYPQGVENVVEVDIDREEARSKEHFELAWNIQGHEQTQLEAAKLLTDRDKQQEVLFPIATCSSMNLFTRYEAIQLLTDEGKKQTAYINLGKGLNQYQLKEYQKILLPITSNENVALTFRLDVAKQISNEEDQQKAYFIIATSPYTKDNHKIIIEAVGLITNLGKQEEALLQIIEQTCFSLTDVTNSKGRKAILTTLKKLFGIIYPLLLNENAKRLLIFKMITKKKIPKDYSKKMVDQHETNADLKTQLLYDIENDQVYQVKTTKSARKGIEIID